MGGEFGAGGYSHPKICFGPPVATLPSTTPVQTPAYPPSCHYLPCTTEPTLLPLTEAQFLEWVLLRKKKPPTKQKQNKTKTPNAPLPPKTRMLARRCIVQPPQFFLSSPPQPLPLPPREEAGTAPISNIKNSESLVQNIKWDLTDTRKSK